METVIIGVVVSFCAGAFAAALGAVGAVTLTGLAAFVALLVAPGQAGHVDFLGVYAFGLYLGPHVSFGPAVAAAAYAGRRGYLEETGKNVLTPLISTGRVSPMVVGGLFGTLGYFLQRLFADAFGSRVDSIALTVTLICIMGKLFGRRGFGEIFARTPDEVKAAGGRYSVRSPAVWLSWQCTPPVLTMVGIFTGGLAGWIAWMMLQNPATAGLAIIPAWAIGVVTFFFFASGLQIPVTHHVGMVAGLAVVQSYAVTHSSISILWGIAFGILGAFGGEFISRTINNFGHGYVDAPAAVIFVASVVVNIPMKDLGLFHDRFVLPAVVIAAAVAYSLYISRKLAPAAGEAQSVRGGDVPDEVPAVG
ncbi:hypothetical protein ACFY6U_00235 [Streptomyces sp. NPDC013157]|uniref:hypothetical protein n=1 Tax=Streptomyces sp. NPDC013157 TaxID=3364861 RepID=UPI0036C89161